VIQGTEAAVNENEAGVQDTAYSVTGKHSEDTTCEEVTESFSNTAGKSDDVTVIRKKKVRIYQMMKS
jgi:hypothetical protein